MLFAVAAAAGRFSGFAVKFSGATVGTVVGSPERQLATTYFIDLVSEFFSFYFCESHQPTIFPRKIELMEKQDAVYRV